MSNNSLRLSADSIAVSSRLSGILNTIGENPSSSAFWELLSKRARDQNDQLSLKSLHIIIEGLKRIENITAQAQLQKIDPPKIPAFFQARFLRLAGAYNNPRMLTEVGMMYLHDMDMPEVALQHFKCSLRLGAPAKELLQLCEAASTSMRNKIGTHAPTVTLAQNVKPVASSIISKTGSMLMRSRIRHSAVVSSDVADSMEATVWERPLPETGSSCLEEAKEAITSGLLVRAEALLKKATLDPTVHSDLWQAWTDLGLAYYDAGRYPEVESAFVEALKYNSDEVASLFNVALGYHINDKTDLALSFYQRANEMEPNNSKILCNLGVLHFQRNQYPEAEFALRSSILGRPDYARAWDNLAATFGAQNRLEDALVACQRTVEINPDFPEAHFKAGIIYFSQEEYEKASSALQKARIVPLLTAYCELFQAMIYSRTGELEEADAAIHRAVNADPQCDLLLLAWKEIGSEWNSRGNYLQAATAYSEATLLKPDEPDSWYLLSIIYQHLGEADSAAKAYQQALDLNTSFRSPPQ